MVVVAVAVVAIVITCATMTGERTQTPTKGMERHLGGNPLASSKRRKTHIKFFYPPPTFKCLVGTSLENRFSAACEVFSKLGRSIFRKNYIF